MVDTVVYTVAHTVAQSSVYGIVLCMNRKGLIITQLMVCVVYFDFFCIGGQFPYYKPPGAYYRLLFRVSNLGGLYTEELI